MNDTHAAPTQKSIKLSLPIPPAIHAALEREAKAERRELTEHIQRILSEHAINSQLVEPSEARRTTLTWKLVARAVDEAQEICRSGRFDSAVTL